MMAEIEQVKTIVVLDSDSMDAIAAKVNLWHQSAINLAATSLDYIKNCGVALLEAKARCGHGGWLDWLSEKCPDISERTCQRYMKIAQEWAVIEAAASDAPLTAAGALTLIASHTTKSDSVSDLRLDRIDPVEASSPRSAEGAFDDGCVPIVITNDRLTSAVGGGAGHEVGPDSVTVPLPNVGERLVAHVDSHSTVEILRSGGDMFFVTRFCVTRDTDLVEVGYTAKHVLGVMVVNQILGLSSLNADDIADIEWRSEPQEPLPGRYHPLHDGEASWAGPNPNTAIYSPPKLSL